VTTHVLLVQYSITQLTLGHGTLAAVQVTLGLLMYKADVLSEFVDRSETFAAILAAVFLFTVFVDDMQAQID